VKPKEFDETVMVKILDEYSERLVSMLDERIAASVAQRVRESSISNISEGAESPRLDYSPQRERADSEATMEPIADETITEDLVVQSIETNTTG
jgi:hypothetical protein